jgi:hypothetical protein
MTSQMHNEKFSTRSCTKCYLRKVKCDRQRPCSNCVVLNDVCIIPNTPIRRQRRKKRADDSGRHFNLSSDSTNSDALDVDLNSRFAFDENPFMQNHQPKDPGEHWTPTFKQIQTSWRLYTRNVDPFIRILHKPSIYRLIMRVKDQDLSILCEEEVALILSICFASISTLTSAQCIWTFGKDEGDLYQRSKDTAELAICRAKLFQKPDIRTLQAYTIVLVRLNKHIMLSQVVLTNASPAAAEPIRSRSGPLLARQFASHDP